ncbi:hypothetical protein HK098_006628 [Nowakowskiella sp. JEL0407]|nr:hypothetical protein HK098_006628 [Nowakowskiella sp. JEL0407]
MPTFPAPRGDNDDTFFDAPCGGFNSSTPRSIVPFKFLVNFTNLEEAAFYSIGIALGNGESLTNSSFATRVASGVSGDLAVTNVTIDTTTLSTKPTDGSNATIQIYYDGGPKMRLYACADVVFNASATAVTLPPKKSASTSPSASPSPKSGTSKSLKYQFASTFVGIVLFFALV